MADERMDECNSPPSPLGTCTKSTLHDPSLSKSVGHPWQTGRSNCNCVAGPRSRKVESRAGAGLCAVEPASISVRQRNDAAGDTVRNPG
jgi:hypothetical protein